MDIGALICGLEPVESGERIVKMLQIPLRVRDENRVRHAGQGCAKLGFALAQRSFRLFARRKVAIDFEHPFRLAGSFAQEYLAAFRYDGAAVAACMNQFPFPSFLPLEEIAQLRNRDAGPGLEQLMNTTAERFLLAPAIQLPRAGVPPGNRTIAVGRD